MKALSALATKVSAACCGVWADEVADGAAVWASAGLAIDSLERKQLVSRQQHPEDRRVWRIVPTARARGLLHELRETVDEVYAQLFAGFDDGELAQLRGFFDRIARNLKD